ncbi:terpene cyclase/mutase family protein [Roseiconus nitratireducens]|uniref:Terpene cyclase/mutase family protein n=1 Tax=Roseiconus nitratireducens TaxID=2605748 RepID=A0A5M6DA02_9BACT|nr:prenyltransferase/squalene oxidase repeat-containing protein [Roseiconus nitratireducens]KAA5544377.1 terpene cyclase/mutase family protein [Roseiconus nitratireducens]
MFQKSNRRDWLCSAAALGGSALGAVAGVGGRSHAAAASSKASWETATQKALSWLSKTQSSRGHWNTQVYPTAMAALSGTAMISSGSTTTQGPFAKQIARTADYLISKSRDNGLIGDPQTDQRYTYGHGFAMLFLSQVLGEEGLLDRRRELVDVLSRAVEFSGNAQTAAGGWGYVSAAEGNDFDEGSTTITQVQGLRGCRNAGIPVSSDVIERAKQYIYECKNKDGGISYSSRQRGNSRPAITAAALAALYNAGDYDSEHVPEMWAYTKEQLHSISDGARAFGHWHYTYLYYSQVVYRQGDELWLPFRAKLYDRIVSQQRPDGSWDGQIHPVYVTACNLIMLQLDYGYLPIYQR